MIVLLSTILVVTLVLVFGPFQIKRSDASPRPNREAPYVITSFSNPKFSMICYKAIIASYIFMSYNVSPPTKKNTF